MLKSISDLIGILILNIGEIIFARLVLNDKIKVSKLKLLIVLLLVSILFLISNTYLIGILNTFVVLIVHIFEYKYLFKIEYSKSIVLTLMYFVIILIQEILGFLILVKLLNLNMTFFYNEFVNSVIGNSFTFIIFMIVTILLKTILRKFINYKVHNNTKIVIYSILTYICVATVFYNAFIDVKFDYNLVISIFTMTIFIGILLSLIKQTIDNANITKKYEQILEFMTTYEEEIEKQRVIRHETKNAFISIKAQITDEYKVNNIIDYINSVLNDDTKIKFEEYAKFKNLPANGIKGLFYYKMQEAENKGIKVSINISSRIPNSRLYRLNVKEIKELGKVLGVFLDNAIEASELSKDKVIGIEAYIVNNSVKIIISNSYNGEIDESKIGQIRYSTKGKNRGHGLLLVKGIINSNNIFEVKTEVTDKLYIQNIIIKESTD